MKKTLSLLTALIMAFALVACSGNTASVSDDTAETAAGGSENSANNVDTTPPKLKRPALYEPKISFPFL